MANNLPIESLSKEKKEFQGIEQWLIIPCDQGKTAKEITKDSKTESTRQLEITLYDQDKIAKEITKDSKKDSESTRKRLSLLREMQQNGATRKMVPSPSLEVFQELMNGFPHFGSAVKYYESCSALSMLGESGLEADPVLLVGAPGLGKTFFCEELARILATGYSKITLSTVSNSFVICGASLVWNSGKPGRVWQELVKGNYANPVIVLDEIDKMRAFGENDPSGPLYDLLEKHSAKKFVDEALDGDPTIDASHIIWIATANDTSSINPALLSRFKIIEISKPHMGQMAELVKQVYKTIIKNNSWGAHFSKARLEEDVIRLLTKLDSAREVKEALKAAFANAALHKRNYLIVQDFGAEFF